MFKVNKRDITTASVDLDRMSLIQTLYFFTIFLVFVLLSLNMQLFAGQLRYVRDT